VPAAADAVVLELHDGSGAERAVGLEIAGEGGHGGHEYYHLKRPAGLVGADDAVNYRAPDLVGYRVLGLRRGGYEELVLDIDEVPCVGDGVDVRIGDAVLGCVAGGPSGGAALLACVYGPMDSGGIPSRQLDVGLSVSLLSGVLPLTVLVTPYHATHAMVEAMTNVTEGVSRWPLSTI
jgi:hypothetical protein